MLALSAAGRIRCGERAIAGLKPDDTESAEQTEQGADLKLPLANDVAFLRKKCEREQGSENYRRAIEDRVNAGAHVEERNDLCDLMDDIGNARDEAKAERVDVDLGASATHAVEDKWCDGKAGDGVTVEILRERLVVADQVELKERRHRPNGNAGEECGVSSGELPGVSRHAADCGMALRFRSLICWLARH